MAEQRTMALDNSMAGKTVVITGATSGLGAVAAETLATRGARIVLIARDRARAEAALTRIRQRNPAANHTLHLADLSSLAEMKRVAAEVAAAEPRIDVLANNAGAMFGTRQLTVDGLERTFATNHMAYVVLTLGLKDVLTASKARVVNTASGAYRGARFDPADLQSLRRYSAIRAYANSKLYNILFTRELGRRWRPRGITVNCFHPGFVATRFGDNNGGWMKQAIGALKLFAISPQKGASTLVYLASAPDAAQRSGEYFFKSAPLVPGPTARDDKAAAVLWAESLKLAGITDP